MDTYQWFLIAAGGLLISLGVFLVFFECKHPDKHGELRNVEFLGIKIKSGRSLLWVLIGALLILSPQLFNYLNRDGGATAHALVPKPDPNNVVSVNKLSQVESGNFLITKDIRVLDLRSRRRTPKDRVNDRYSPVTWIRYTLVEKLRPADRMIFQFKTSGTGLDVRCVTHASTLKQFTEPAAFAHSTRGIKEQWEIDVDVSSEKVGEEFLVITEATYYNAFRGETGDWASVRATYKTDNVGFLLLFPKDKALKSYVLRANHKASGKKEEYNGARYVHKNRDGYTLFWSIDKPKVDYDYDVEWNW